jgi:hypothetical protein
MESPVYVAIFGVSGGFNLKDILAAFLAQPQIDMGERDSYIES